MIIWQPHLIEDLPKTGTQASVRPSLLSTHTFLLNPMFSAILALLSITLAVSANPHIQNRHHDIAKRHSPDVQLYKRFTSARWTYYDVGLSVIQFIWFSMFAHK